MTFDQLLQDSTNRLRAAGIKTARLDSLILLEITTKKDRLWLLAHGDEEVSSEPTKDVQRLVAQRANRIPLAYLTKHQEFYGRTFTVSSDVLIPRPETEEIIEAAKKINAKKILDVGTGSGAIAVTLALETNANITATDISPRALKIAKANAKTLHAPVAFVQSDLLKNIDGQFDLIVANLPYVDPVWNRSPETNYEPKLALFAQHEGLDLIYKLITQAPHILTASGHVILEADPRQHKAIVAFAKAFTAKTRNFVVELKLKPRSLAEPVL